jgi:hypothetical protein
LSEPTRKRWSPKLICQQTLVLPTRWSSLKIFVPSGKHHLPLEADLQAPKKKKAKIGAGKDQEVVTGSMLNPLFDDVS